MIQEREVRFSLLIKNILSNKNKKPALLFFLNINLLKIG